jgi:hypothetical protein
MLRYFPFFSKVSISSTYIRPCLNVAKRGYECRIALYKVFNYILYRLHTGCQWEELPIDKLPDEPDKSELTYHAVYHHYRKWSRDGSLARVFEQSILSIADQLDTHHLNLDGSQAIAKKGGEEVAYQGHKKAKTSNVLPITDANGCILATTGIVAGNHNDAFELKDNLRTAFKFIKGLGISIAGSYFNADSAFDTKAARWSCFNHQLIPNSALANSPSPVPNDVSMLRCTSSVSPVHALSLGLTNSAPYLSVLTAVLPISWVLTLLSML